MPVVLRDGENLTCGRMGVLSPCLCNLYAEYIMRNAGLEEAQAGIEIAGRNINNLSYADDTTLMAESEELHLYREQSGEIKNSKIIPIAKDAKQLECQL